MKINWRKKKVGDVEEYILPCREKFNLLKQAEQNS